jgi:dTDP-4-dehydrorhamnose reductase
LARRIVYTSTDLVFDGGQAPYAEADEPRPCSRYGLSKLEGERALAAHPNALVVRLSLLYGPTLLEDQGFFDQQLATLRRGDTLTLFEDEWRTPIALDEAANALVELYEGSQRGILHLGGPKRLSRYEMGRQLAEVAGVNPDLVKGNSQAEIDFPEPRPQDVSLITERVRSILENVPGDYRSGLRRLV